MERRLAPGAQDLRGEGTPKTSAVRARQAKSGGAGSNAPREAPPLESRMTSKRERRSETSETRERNRPHPNSEQQSGDKLRDCCLESSVLAREGSLQRGSLTKVKRGPSCCDVKCTYFRWLRVTACCGDAQNARAEIRGWLPCCFERQTGRRETPTRVGLLPRTSG